MLQVEIVFFAPSVKESASNTITKKANLARLHISTAEVKVYIDFQCMPMPEQFFLVFIHADFSWTDLLQLCP